MKTELKLFRGGTVVLGHTVSQTDVLVQGERIRAVGDLGDVGADEVIDAGGLLVLPGAVDTHVHFNDVFMGTVSVHDYYLGTPAVDRIVYQIYANWDAVIQALRSGEIDLTESFIPVSYIPVLEEAEGVVVETRPPGPVQTITFNVYAGGTKHPAIDDAKVREAIDYAIDKQRILDITFEGYGILCPTNWACGPNFEGELNPDLEVTPFDPTMAAQILDEAGYLDTDGDGVREMPDGLPLDFRLYISAESPTDLVSADLVQQMLRDVGIETEVEAIESGALWSLVLGERDFDMTIRDTMTDLDPAYTDYTFSCWSADFGEGALNESGYCNEEVDNLTFEYITQPNMAEALPYIFEAQAIINQDRPIINLAASFMVEAYRTDRFDFPAPGESCDMNPGYWDWPLILELPTNTMTNGRLAQA